LTGCVLKMGTRLGLSAKTILDAIRVHCPQKTLICLDPYGSIIYEGREGQPCRLDYTNEMKATCMSNLWADVVANPVSFKYFDLEDSEFFTRFSDGVPVYELEKKIVNSYSFVFFDGPHTVRDVMAEINFFHSRTQPGSTYVFDDVTPDFYDHSQIDKWLLGNGYVKIKEGNKKALYQKL
jgi:hypothetical protein